ncbi:DNA-processing protein DprA [Lacicoccus qingdaonensis]|uniref:DNA processing protein n=1 Tax=Lacicoccus qingdaonensis TaxID=576118 RepID=A0A1G9A8W6_9BACL|nr:DNA-processing protein DprA [Salinicoccus qingdaonensis]SDK23789.1 DNA processing protein [Salinicoccus qingdaonensis]
MNFLALSYAGITVQEYQAIKNSPPEFRLPEKIQTKLSAACRLNMKQIMMQLADKNITYMTIDDKDYPALLKEIHDPPYILYLKGDRSLLNRPMLGIVGSRKATRYTSESLADIIPELKNICVVSGLAYGADEIAHKLCLSSEVSTAGVLAFGHDLHYPKSTYSIRARMEQKGLTISEYPPHASIEKWRFIARNRIIAGLSRGILVTEAEEKSGSLITLEMAMNENRNTYCLPGNITSLLSKGTNARLQEGAEMVLRSEDIMKDYF